MTDPIHSNSPPSPCIKVCRLDRRGLLCVGCLRTTDEIAAWPTLDDAARREVLRRVAARRRDAGDAGGIDGRRIP